MAQKSLSQDKAWMLLVAKIVGGVRQLTQRFCSEPKTFRQNHGGEMELAELEELTAELEVLAQRMNHQTHFKVRRWIHRRAFLLSERVFSQEQSRNMPRN